MESLSFPGGKHVGIRPSSDPVKTMFQAANLAMLFDAAGFMRAANQRCRMFDQYRKSVKASRRANDRQRYIEKCYPKHFLMKVFFGKTAQGDLYRYCRMTRLPNGNVVSV